MKQSWLMTNLELDSLLLFCQYILIVIILMFDCVLAMIPGTDYCVLAMILGTNYYYVRLHYPSYMCIYATVSLYLL